MSACLHVCLVSCSFLICTLHVCLSCACFSPVGFSHVSSTSRARLAVMSARGTDWMGTPVMVLRVVARPSSRGHASPSQAELVRGLENDHARGCLLRLPRYGQLAAVQRCEGKQTVEGRSRRWGPSCGLDPKSNGLGRAPYGVGSQRCSPSLIWLWVKTRTPNPNPWYVDLPTQ